MMRVGLIFSDYRGEFPSGERQVVRAEHDALERVGVDVRVITSATDELSRQPLYALRAAGRVATGLGRNPLEDLANFGPDVVHIHNVFPNFGTQWVARIRVPLVLTLHNYRMICAQGSLYRAGLICTACLDSSHVAGLLHRCYRGSALATLPLTIANSRGLARNPLVARADAIVVLSELEREIMVNAGLPADRTVLAANFLPDTLIRPEPSSADRRGWLFVGRLEEQKGILQLLDHWPATESLIIVGDGPLLAEVRRLAPGNIAVHGQLPRASVMDLLHASEGLIYASTTYETQGLVNLEAAAAGTPVIALDGSAVAQAVQRLGTGLVMADLAEIPQAMSRLRADWPRFSSSALDAYRRTYSESVWVRERIALYESVIGLRQ